MYLMCISLMCLKVMISSNHTPYLSFCENICMCVIQDWSNPFEELNDAIFVTSNVTIIDSIVFVFVIMLSANGWSVF